MSVLEGGYRIQGGIVSAFGRSVAGHVRALVDGCHSRQARERQRGEERPSACLRCLLYASSDVTLRCVVLRYVTLCICSRRASSPEFLRRVARRVAIVLKCKCPLYDSLCCVNVFLSCCSRGVCVCVLSGVYVSFHCFSRVLLLIPAGVERG